VSGRNYHTRGTTVNELEQLLVLLARRGIKLPSTTTKANLVERLRGACIAIDGLPQTDDLADPNDTDDVDDLLADDKFDPAIGLSFSDLARPRK
jgi:hypothetical protein